MVFWPEILAALKGEYMLLPKFCSLQASIFQLQKFSKQALEIALTSD